MTRNQIEYNKLLETQRSNQAQEDLTRARDQRTLDLRGAELRETSRANLEREAQGRASLDETVRSHKASEQQRAQELMETIRSHRANEEEAHRSNLARETETHRSNVAKETETNRSNVAKETETARSNLATETETHRANVARETETGRANVAKETETERANKAREAIDIARNVIETAKATAQTIFSTKYAPSRNVNTNLGGSANPVIKLDPAKSSPQTTSNQDKTRNRSDKNVQTNKESQEHTFQFKSPLFEYSIQDKSGKSENGARGFVRGNGFSGLQK